MGKDGVDDVLFVYVDPNGFEAAKVKIPKTWKGFRVLVRFMSKIVIPKTVKMNTVNPPASSPTALPVVAKTYNKK